MTVSIRPMVRSDLPALRPLLSQLGYEMPEREVARRYDSVMSAADHALLVAEQDGRVIALLHIYARPALDKPPEAVIQALIVDRSCRGRGVGARMMTQAEHWARGRGFRSVALASNIIRFDAHAFYESIGYRIEATSHLMRKTVA